MPCREQSDQLVMSVTPDWLVENIINPSSEIIVLDCRPTSDFHHSHVRGAINVTLPASVIMLRRLANGKFCIPSFITDSDCRERFVKTWKQCPIVLYAESDGDMSKQGPSVLCTLYHRLQQDGCHVVCLQEGFNEFASRYPEWCENGRPEEQVETTLQGLGNLCISPVMDIQVSDADKCDSGLTSDSPNDPPFPVEILPYLFLGNAENSTDLEALERHKIRYIINVTPNLPNAFENEGIGIKYMQIPIHDHWSQNLASFFPDAIAFIDDARQKKQGVLVHCVAGISRSVTITLAYLMHKLSMPLNDAYDFVRRRKANISPNFNFMGQLLDYERQLNLTPGRCTCQETPCKCRVLHFISPTRSTPDSGIDIDRWT